MKHHIYNGSRRPVSVGTFAYGGIWFLLMETTSLPATSPAYTSTNASDAFLTNPPLHTDEFTEYKRRADQLIQAGHSGLSNATDNLVEGARALIKDYPKYPHAYELMLRAML